MTTPVRALMAVDLKTRPEPLVDEGAAWVARMNCVLDLVYVDEMGIPMPHVHDANVQKVVEENWKRDRAEHFEPLHKLLERVPAANRGKAILATGAVTEAVVRLAEGYDLVVIGNDSRRGFAALFGSATESLLRRFEKPVLMLRVHPGA